MTRRRRFHIGCFGVLVVLGLGFGAVWALDAFFSAPWAYDIGGRPTLTGAWSGPFTSSAAAGGARGTLALELNRGRRRVRHGWFGSYVKTSYFDHSLGGADVYGAAAWCRPDGSVITYRVGGVVDRKAQKIALSLTPDSVVRVPGTQFRELRGSWDGASSMSLRSEMRVYVPGHGKGLAYGPAPEFPIALTKTTAATPTSSCPLPR